MLCINLPYNQPRLVDSSLHWLIEAPDTAYCRSTFLVNPGLSSDSEAVNYSVTLYFIRRQINYMKFCLLDFNGCWPLAVLNYFGGSSSAHHVNYVDPCFGHIHCLFIG